MVKSRIVNGIMNTAERLRRTFRDEPGEWVERHAMIFAAVRAMFGPDAVEDYQESFRRPGVVILGKKVGDP